MADRRVLNLSVDSATHRELRLLAARADTTVRELVRVVLVEFLAELDAGGSTDNDQAAILVRQLFVRNRLR